MNYSIMTSKMDSELQECDGTLDKTNITLVDEVEPQSLDLGETCIMLEDLEHDVSNDSSKSIIERTVPLYDNEGRYLSHAPLIDYVSEEPSSSNKNTPQKDILDQMPVNDNSRGDLDAMPLPSLQKKVCPYCGVSVSKISRHLKTHKHLSKDEVKKACNTLRQRRKFTSSSRIPRKCPYDSCAGVKPFHRLDMHLLSYHKLKKNDKEYSLYVKTTNTPTSSCASRVEDKIYKEISTPFYEWLQTLQGGLTKEENAKHHFYKITQILKEVGIKHVLHFIEESNEKKIEDWLMKYAYNHTPGSALTYLSCIIVFLNYIGIVYRNEISHQRLTFFKDSLKMWKKPILKLDKQTYKPTKSINIDDTAEFESTTYKKEVDDLLNSATTADELLIDKMDYAKVRNTLMIQILLHNPNRSCALANLQVDEFNNYVIEVEDGEDYYVVQVYDHKTVREHGPARLSFPTELYGHLNIYCKVFRQFVIDKCSENNQKQFFLTWTGNNVNSDIVNKGIQTAWKNAGFASVFRNRVLRKTSVTVVWENEKPEVRNIVASHMSHRVSTAESKYKEHIKNKSAVKSSKIIYNLLTKKKNKSELPSSNINQLTLANKTPQSVMYSHSPKQVNVNHCQSTNSNESFDSDVTVQQCTSSDNLISEIPDIQHTVFEGSPTVDNISSIESDNHEVTLQDFVEDILKSGTRGRISFTDAQRREIFYCFMEYIESETIPMLKVISERLQSNQLQSINKSKNNILNSIKGCIIGLINRKKKFFENLRK